MHTTRCKVQPCLKLLQKPRNIPVKGGQGLTSLRKGGSTLPATATDPISQKQRLKKVCRFRFGNNLMIKYLQAKAGVIISDIWNTCAWVMQMCRMMQGLCNRACAADTG